MKLLNYLSHLDALEWTEIMYPRIHVHPLRISSLMLMEEKRQKRQVAESGIIMTLTALREEALGVERTWLSLAFCQAQCRAFRNQVGLNITTLRVPRRLAQTDLTADLVGADILLVLVDDRATEAALKDDDWCKDEARSNLDEGDLRLSILALGCGLAVLIVLFASTFGFSNLVDANPNLAIHTKDTDDAVNKRLHALNPTLGNTENSTQHFSDQSAVLVSRAAHNRTLFVKRPIENDNATATLQDVAAKPSV